MNTIAERLTPVETDDGFRIIETEAQRLDRQQRGGVSSAEVPEESEAVFF